MPRSGRPPRPAREKSTRVLSIGKELVGETVPLHHGRLVYRVDGLRPSAWYEVKISYPASIPSSFSIQLVDDPEDADWSSKNRRLLNTEKIIFKAEGSSPVYVLVTVEPEGVLAKPNVPERELALFNIVMAEVKKIRNGESLYIGNMNYHHKPFRDGKWAVTYEEWPEEDFPIYADGPGYVISSDIADAILSEFLDHKLRLFNMEDVSMGMWVEQFNSTGPVKYVNSVKFCQFGCIDDYYTAHYQSPRQMLCLWDKLQAGKAQCCNMR
ncbi:hypothetical protein C2845_PM07G03220 [Panicum miliaceum]|uniref:Uncharacterized protein n=1 Tax=Panicum miliaceum TaxID=4540 RepID=A0A3L6SUD2_PANMI|nr:hypothetical protein C2845_PM07G03220 [Panicum miliaceum]